MDDGSLGRHGLGSSSSYLDGVPFKIGLKFRPPPKVIYQPVIETNYSGVPRDEYTYETEEAVLAWAKARDDALKKASIEQAKTLAEKKAKSDQQEASHVASSANCSNSSIQNSTIGTNETKPTPIKPFIPKPNSEPNAILKPTPIQLAIKGDEQSEEDEKQKVNTNSAVDVSMFENVADPFDTLELQTLDDMEELKILLDSSSKVNDTSNPIEAVPEATEAPGKQPDVDMSESFYELAAPIPRPGWEQFDSDPIPKAMNNDASSAATSSKSTRSSDSPIPDLGEYIDPDKKSSVFNGINSTKQISVENDASRAVNSQSGLSPRLDSANGIYKPVLPPIASNHPKQLNGVSHTRSTEQSDNIHPTNPFSTPVSATASDAQSNTNISESSDIFQNRSKPLRIPPPPPTKPRVNAPVPRPRSSGQLLSSAGLQPATDSTESGPKPAEQHTVNPFSLHGMSISNYQPQSEETQLKFNDSYFAEGSSPVPVLPQLGKYRPLPPSPAQRSLGEKGSQSQGLTDPYASLSREGQEFTDRVTCMGFLRAKVARAVQKFGQDEKEVLDHLFAADVLVEKKFAPIHVEAALQSCNNDLDKAERFLKMQSQLEQLGFNSDKVRDALITSDMDHDKTLDLLTA